VTDVGGNREMIEHERHGLVVPPDSLEHLASAIDRLLRDRSFSARLAANARQRALAEYGVQSQARRYEDFYHGLLRRKLKSASSRDATRASP